MLYKKDPVACCGVFYFPQQIVIFLSLIFLTAVSKTFTCDDKIF